MHLLVLFLLLVGCLGDIKVSVDQGGRFNISVNDRIWLRSSRTAIYVDNKWYSSDDNSLPLTNLDYTQGNDPNLGSWNETQLIYDLVRSGIHTEIVGHIRQWNAVSAMTFHLDTGNQTLINTIPLDMDDVRTVFPSFHIEQMATDDQRGYFTFEGEIIFQPYFLFWIHNLIQEYQQVMVINMRVVGIHQAKLLDQVCKAVQLLFLILLNKEKVIYCYFHLFLNLWLLHYLKQTMS